jgi:hypothetical protein
VKIQFQGSPNPDEVADAFILAFVGSRKGSPVSAEQVWRSLRTRGFVPTDGRRSSQSNPDEGAAVAEIGRRLRAWRHAGLLGGDGEPEAITNIQHYWAIGSSLTTG